VKEEETISSMSILHLQQEISKLAAKAGFQEKVN